MAAIIAFYISLAALIVFLAFKMFERSRPLSGYVSLRSKGDVVVLSVLTNLRERAEYLEDQLSMHNVVRVTTQHAALTLAHAARYVEVWAYDLTRKMSRNGGGARATNSSFLREVSSHKKNLDTDRVRRESSLTSDLEEER